MATVKLGNTKVANKLISYAEKKAVEKEGVNCTPEHAKAEFKNTRELWGKTDGIQAHHVIQSFKPGEIEPDLANKIGQDLAKKIAKGHEAVVYTHTDKSHIHNHIVINAVSHEDGKKYQSKKKDLYKVRELSDQICKEKGLSVVAEPNAKVRYKLAEKSIIEKGGTSWKDEIRKAINFEKVHSENYKEFKNNLKYKHGIEVNDTKKHITYKHPDHERVVRGKNLGLDYERGTIENVFSRKAQSRISGESRGISTSTEILLGKNRESYSFTNSGASESIKQNNSNYGRNEIKGQDENGDNSQDQRSSNFNERGNEVIERNEHREARKELQGNISGEDKESGFNQRSDKPSQGYGVSSKKHTESELEGKSKAVHSTGSSNDRNNTNASRSLSPDESFNEFLDGLKPSNSKKKDELEENPKEVKDKEPEIKKIKVLDNDLEL